MFTGLVDHCGEIISVSDIDAALLLTIDSQFSNFIVGESIAVDGVCLTVVAANQSQFSVQVSSESIKVTRMQHYQSGTRVNLERALTVGQALGGHFVTGHVDTTVMVSSIEGQGDFQEIHFSTGCDQSLLSQKGSVTINGVSLTINSVMDTGFTVMLIPHTLERTNLSSLQVSDVVNLEYDMFAKMIQRQLSIVPIVDRRSWI